MFISIRTLAEDAVKMSRAYVKKLNADPHLWKKVPGLHERVLPDLTINEPLSRHGG